MRLLDAVVDEPDLEALAGGGEVLSPERRGADQGRPRARGRFGRDGASVAQRVIGHTRPDSRAGERAQARELGGREDHRHAVERHPVVPVDAGCRNRHSDPRREGALRRRQRAEIRDRGRRAHGDGVAPACRCRKRPAVRDCGRERGPRQGDDDLDEPPGGTRRGGRRSARQQREDRSEGEREREQ